MIIAAVVLITIAHVIRIMRWELLIETYEKPDGKRLTKSLSLGYFISYFLPFKAGDFFRALYAGSSMINGRGFALATVVIERCLDILTVGLIFVAFSLFEVVSTETAVYYIVLAVLLFTILILIFITKKYIKKAILTCCGLLNDKYEEKALRFFWALIWGFKDIVNRISKIRLGLYTVVMWGLYLVSYGVFSLSLMSAGVDSRISGVLLSLFDQKSLLSSGVNNGISMNTETVYYAVFLLAPSFILYFGVLLIGRFIKFNGNDNEELNLIPQINVDERRNFLKMYFDGEKRDYIESYLKINRNILVLRDYSAGSNATTILCTDGKNSFYRKYAFSNAASKLEEQVLWIKEHSELLPLTEIIRDESGDGFCYYDMEYSGDAITLFEYLQDGDAKKGFSILKNVFGILEESLYCDDKEKKEKITADKDELAQKYIREKALANYDYICNHKALANVINCDTIYINGVCYPGIKAYKEMLSMENLKGVFLNDEISGIHGDLTIENIVCLRGTEEFYLIDPNGGNIFNSKYIDYAKVLQSLHGHYEFLMAVDEVSVNGNRIDFKYVESRAYKYMYDEYNNYLGSKFTKDEIKSIYYHEAVNWLRLMPYKLEKGRGVLFYAGLLMVLKDIANLN